MLEIRWLKERGLVASYDDYWNLPAQVLEDARLLAEVEALVSQHQAAHRG